MSETISMIHISAGSLSGQISLTNVTGETPDVSEYLDLVFMTKYCSKIMLVHLPMNMVDD